MFVSGCQPRADTKPEALKLRFSKVRKGTGFVSAADLPSEEERRNAGRREADERRVRLRCRRRRRGLTPKGMWPSIPQRRQAGGGLVFRNWACPSYCSIRLAQMRGQQPRTEPCAMCRPATCGNSYAET